MVKKRHAWDNKHLIQETAPGREEGKWDQESIDRRLQFYLYFTHQGRVGDMSGVFFLSTLFICLKEFMGP